MAIRDNIRGGDKARSVPSGGKHQMTVKEFKNWLMTFDFNNDGQISQKELRAAIRSCGVWFSTWRSSQGMTEADKDCSGYIDEDEMDSLLEFAEKCMGFKFY